MSVGRGRSVRWMLERRDIDFLDALELAGGKKPEADELTCKQRREKERAFEALARVLIEREILGIEEYTPLRRLARGNVSKNIGIPEKFRGWEFQDIQYHGGQFYDGEW